MLAEAPVTENRLTYVVDNKVTPIWNAMGVIPGLIRDEVVVVGNHRDGDIYSASIVWSNC